MTRLERAFVWSGGFLFVGSIAFTGWWYVEWLGRDRPPAGWDAAAVNALLFSVFALHHSALARPSAQAALARLVPERLLRSVYVWIASILLILVCLFWRPIGGAAFHVQGLLAVVHGAAQAAGVILVALSVRAIDALDLAGIRPGRPVRELQTRGPYGIVRHPIYLGWMLVAFGTARMTGDRLAFAAISSAYLMIAVGWEERSLEREHGTAYREYRKKVRWRIVPYIY